MLGWKKRKTDKPISTLKKSELLRLWHEWKARWDEPPVFKNDIVMSVCGPSNDTTVTDDAPSIATLTDNSTNVNLSLQPATVEEITTTAMI